MAANGELWRLSAADVVDLLRRREVSPLELVEASAERIAATDGHLNAIPTLCIERARAHAERIMAEGPDTARPRGWLGGVPIAVKDLVEVEGVRTTWGSPIYADHVPPRSDIVVETLEARGAIVIGKSNTPEFGAGANTFNEVFGKTRNPVEHWRSRCAGSSGGAAAALVAAGEVWLASGLGPGRQPAHSPASFNSRGRACRPSSGPGRARADRSCRSRPSMVAGPIARNARDTCAVPRCHGQAQHLGRTRSPSPRPAETLPPRPCTTLPKMPGQGSATARTWASFPWPVEVAEVSAVCAGGQVRKDRGRGRGGRPGRARTSPRARSTIFQVLRAAQVRRRHGAELLEAHRDRAEAGGHLEHREGARASRPTRSARAERERAAASTTGCVALLRATTTCCFVRPA